MNRTATFATAFLLALAIGCGSGSLQLAISPAGNVQLDQGATLQFAASVTGSSNTAVTWSVQEVGGGTITPTGSYTAPAMAGVFHVVAISVADTSRNAICAVTVHAVSLTVSPSGGATLDQGASQQFTATVTGTTNTAVTWSMQEPGGGSVTPTGLYTAPTTAGSYHVLATSSGDSSKTSVSAVTVRAVSLAVAPATETLLDQGATQQFTATVTGTTNTAVTWSVQEAGGGRVTPTGLYTSPNTAGSYHVLATSSADSSKISVSPVTVREVNVTIPLATENEMDQGANLQFTATVRGTIDRAVTWSVLEEGGGSISQNGTYTAPNAAGAFHVIATSVANPSVKGTAEVWVSQVVVSDILDGWDGPPSACPTASVGLYAYVTGTVNGAVTWSVVEANGGTITADGVYTAPATSGVFHVKATSVWNPAKSLTAAVDVGRIWVSVTPATIGVTTGLTTSFRASVSSACTNNIAVTWSMAEGDAGGTVVGPDPDFDVTPDAHYTAPATPGTYHVVASSAENPTMTGRATVQVLAEGFHPTGAMSVRRVFHTATLLDSGEVLVTGGAYACDFDSGDDVPACYTGQIPVWTSAELYNPTNGQFYPVGLMAAPRVGHAAVRLPDGKVLVVGGSSQHEVVSALATAELYDTATGMFAPTGSMATTRYKPTATLLGNGKVLVTGGLGSSGECARRSAELYDPATGIFTLLGDMTTARAYHTATLMPDGLVMLAGGSQGAGSCGGASLSSTEWFSPATNSFDSYLPSANPFLLQERDSHLATLLGDGRVLISGGWRSSDLSDDGGPWRLAELFDGQDTPSYFSASWMSQQRVFHTATLLGNGHVLLAGGQWGREPYQRFASSAELFDPGSRSFLRISPMGAGRYGHSATVLLDGRVLITGATLNKSAELYQ